MHVVPACVHHGDVGAIGCLASRVARVLEAGDLLDGKAIHVGAQQHGRTRTVAQDPHDARPSDA